MPPADPALGDGADPPLDALDVFPCPDCPPPAGLGDELQDDLRSWPCAGCGGAFVPAASLPRLHAAVELLGGELERATRAGRPGEGGECPSCGHRLDAIVLRGTAACPCASCGGWWLPRYGLHELSRGALGPAHPTSAAGPPAPRPAPVRAPANAKARRRSRPGVRSFGIAAGLLVAVGGAGAVLAWTALRGAPGAAEGSEAPAALFEAARAVHQPAEPAPVELKEGLFGGRPPSWWAQELGAVEGLRDPGPVARRALLAGRAEALGLRVHPVPGRVILSASEELAAQRAARAQQRPGSPIDVPAGPPPDPASFAISVSRASPRHPRVILAPRATGTATLRLQFETGRLDEAHRPGLTRLTQQVMLAGSAHHELAQRLHRAAATLTLETGVEHTALTLTAPAEDFEALARVVLERCLAPRAQASTLQEARARSGGRPVPSGSDWLTEAFAGFVHREPEASQREADQAALRAIPLAEVQRHLRGPMAPGNATVVLAGELEPEAMARLLERYRGGEARVRPAVVAPAPGSHRASAPGVATLFAYATPAGSPEARAAALLAGAILEEHLLRHVRRAGVAYTLFAEPVRVGGLDFLLVGLPAGPESARVGARLGAEVGALVARGIDEATFERNRLHLLAQLQRVNQSSEALASWLVKRPGALEPAVVEALGAITPGAFMELAGPWLAPSQAIQVALAPPEVQPVQQRRPRR